jgi:hypothetical protein
MLGSEVELFYVSKTSTIISLRPGAVTGFKGMAVRHLK